MGLVAAQPIRGRREWTSLAKVDAFGNSSGAPKLSGTSLKMQRLMLVSVLAVGAILPLSVVVFSRSAGNDLGPEIGPTIEAFEARNGQLIAAGSASTQVNTAAAWSRIGSLDRDNVAVLAYTDDVVFALTDRGLLAANPDTLDFSPWPEAARPGAGRGSDEVALDGFVAMGAVDSTVYMVTEAGSTRRIETGTGTALSTSESVVGAPIGRVVIADGDSSTAWGVNADGRLVKTDDAGGSWVEMASSEAVIDVTIDDSVPARLGVLDETGVALSTDAGATWEHIDSPPGLQAIAYDGTTLYGATSVDGLGLTFALIDGEWTVTR